MDNIHEDDNLANRTEVKDNKLHIEKKDVVKKVTRKHKPVDHEREDILRNARKNAHDPVADAKRKISNEIRANSVLQETYDYWNMFKFNVSESVDFIEEGTATGTDLKVEMFDVPTVSESICEALNVKHDYIDPKFHTIGVIEGCFAPIGEMSRNNRVYDEDHYPTILANTILQNKIAMRRMWGTIGHHNKKVDDEDLAKEEVSHVVTCLEVREREDGTPYLYGRAEIINTRAGRALRTYYRSGFTLYVSSRGGGKLLPVPGQKYKRVDKTRYFLETFDVVSDPGFLGACPVPNVAEHIEESIIEDYNGESVMKKDEKVISENVEAKVDEIIVDTVNKAVQPEKKECNETVEDTKEETVEVTEEKSEEVVSEKCDKKEDDKEDDETVDDVVDEATEPKKETEDDEHEKKLGDIVEEKADDKEEDKEDDKEEVTEELKQPETSEEALHLSACLHKSLSEEELAVADYTKRANKFFEHGQETLGSMFMELADDEKEHIGKLKQMMDMLGLTNVEADTKGRMEAVKEVVEAGVVEEPVEEDYKAKYEAMQPVLEELLAMVKDSSANLKQVIAENNESKAKIQELSEKLEALSKVEITEDKDEEDTVQDQTTVDDSDEEDGNQDAVESKEEVTEEKSEEVSEKCDKEEDDKEEDKEDDDKEDDKEEVHESVEDKAEELGEQIAESVEGMELVDETATPAPAREIRPVFSVFRKSAEFTPSEYYSVFKKH